jgi:hypothetical protein
MQFLAHHLQKSNANGSTDTLFDKQEHKQNCWFFPSPHMSLLYMLSLVSRSILQ